MQVIRTVVWAVITAILVAFIAMNWNDASVNFWPVEGENKYLHFQWPVGVIALLFFLLGFVPMWALHRARVWQMARRISSLENSVRAAAAVAPSPSEAAPSDTASQSESEPAETPGTETEPKA